MRNLSPDRVVFCVSAALLTFLYGFATSARQWFPNDLLVQAWQQARAVTGRDDPGIRHFEKPLIHDFAGARVTDEAAMQPGLTFISSRTRVDSKWLPQLAMMDAHGNVLHQWPLDPSAVFADAEEGHPAHNRDLEDVAVHGAHVLPNGDLVANLSMLAAIRIDACGEIQWVLPERAHHSLVPAEDGTYWMSGLAAPDEELEFPGLGRPSMQNTIVHATGDGEVLDEINVLDLLYSGGLAHVVAQSHDFYLDRKNDLTHLNDVEPLGEEMAADFPMFEPGDLLISLNGINLILVFDPETREIRWHYSGTLVRQHDPDFLAGGWIGVFNNRRDNTERGEILGGTQILAIKPGTDSTRVLFPTEASDVFYTDVLGKWQLLENGNVLLTEGVPGRLLEANAAGETVWEWVQATYDGMVPHVQEGTRYDLTPEDVAAWSCSTARTP